MAKIDFKLRPCQSQFRHSNHSNTLSINDISINDQNRSLMTSMTTLLILLLHNFQTYLPSQTLNSLYFYQTNLFEKTH